MSTDERVTLVCKLFFDYWKSCGMTENSRVARFSQEGLGVRGATGGDVSGSGTDIAAGLHAQLCREKERENRLLCMF